ncbi:MAG: DUF1552 domain-containing protein [Myxococcota bacterium]
MILDRRRFLSALGLSGLALGLPRPSWAMSNGPIRRLLIVSTSHGTPYEHWQMDPEGKGPAGSWSADLVPLAPERFSRSLAPLYDQRARMNCFDGLSLATAELDIPGYRHEKGWLHAWTGALVYFTGADLFSTGPSLDQIVARAIGRPDRLPSLELTIGDGRPVAHAGRAQPVPLERDPQKAWDRLFGLSTTADPLRRAQGSVLDFARAEQEALRGRLSNADRSKLDTHFELVRQLEQRLQGLSEATCNTTPERLQAGLDGYNATFDAFSEIVAAAFSCDLTRVATISLGDLPSRDFGWGDYLSGDAHNDLAHRIYDDPRAALGMSDYTAHHAAQMARLVRTLEAIPDEGGSLLDHTLIVWGSELADGWHSLEKYCVTSFGGSWAWPVGRYFHWPWQTTPIRMEAYGGQVNAGLPHQHLLVSIAQAMGLDVDQVGLGDIRNREGTFVDLKGPLKLV